MVLLPNRQTEMEALYIPTVVSFAAARAGVTQRFPSRPFNVSFKSRTLQRNIQNVHSSLVDYCSRVTEHGVMKIPFSLQLTSILLSSDANLKPVILHDSPFAT